MQPWKWPDVPHADVDMVFDCKPVSWDTVYCLDLRAPHFGGHPYGSGCIHAKMDDVVFIGEVYQPFIGMGI